MKALLVLITCVAIAIVAYQFVYPPFAAWTGVDKPMEKEKPAQLAQAPKVELNVPKFEPKPEPKPEPKMEPKPEPAPMVVAPPPPPPEPEKPKDDFVPPTFRTIVEATNNWNALPQSLYTRAFITKVEIPVKSSVGGTKIAAGGQFYVQGQSGPMLDIAPAPGSPFRGQVSIDDTNIKPLVSEVYDKWVVAQVDAARRAYEFKKKQASMPKTAVASAKGSGGDVKPEKDADGKYPLLLASMTSGEVTEVKLDNIKKWGEVTRDKLDGEDVWVVTVTFEATTPFGKFDQDALAHVKNGRVTKWSYAGSGEVIP